MVLGFSWGRLRRSSTGSQPPPEEPSPPAEPHDEAKPPRAEPPPPHVAPPPYAPPHAPAAAPRAERDPAPPVPGHPPPRGLSPRRDDSPLRSAGLLGVPVPRASRKGPSTGTSSRSGMASGRGDRRSRLTSRLGKHISAPNTRSTRSPVRGRSPSRRPKRSGRRRRKGNKGTKSAYVRSPSRSRDRPHATYSKPPSSSNITVVVRCRPLNRKEQAIKSRSVIKVLDEKMVVLLNPVVAVDDYLRINRNTEKRYAFDYAFGPRCGQQYIYERTAKPLIPRVMEGYNATVFAYGATGAGKTHTMSGNSRDPGVMVLMCAELFEEAARSSDYLYSIRLSYVEVYNEYVRDLFVNSDENLDIREDPIKGMTVAGVTEMQAESPEEVMDLLSMGNRNRTTEATGANQHSSRSHAILQIVVQSKSRTAGVESQVRVGKLNLIDLAGSERASHTNNRGIRMLEGANINRSLLSLANCINALVKSPERRGFVPYRDSKLTRLLKDSLGGNCQTVMIANLAPTDFCYEDTHNTLKYANRAKNIKMKVERNVQRVSHHLAEYSRIINELREEVTNLKDKLAESKQTRRQEREVDTAAEIAGGPSLLGGLGIANLNRQEQRKLQSARTLMMDRFSGVMQMKRVMLDIEDQSQRLRRSIANNNLIVHRWESQPGNKAGHSPSRTPKDVRVANLTVQRLQAELSKVADEKKGTMARLKTMWRYVEDFRKNMAQHVPDSKVRKILEVEYRVHKLQMDKMDLEDSSTLYRDALKQRDETIRRLEEQVRLRDQIMDKQATLLREVPELPTSVLPPAGDLVGINTLRREMRDSNVPLREIPKPRGLRRTNSWILPVPQQWEDVRRKSIMPPSETHSRDASAASTRPVTRSASRSRSHTHLTELQKPWPAHPRPIDPIGLKEHPGGGLPSSSPKAGKTLEFPVHSGDSPVRVTRETSRRMTRESSLKTVRKNASPQPVDRNPRRVSPQKTKPTTFRKMTQNRLAMRSKAIKMELAGINNPKQVRVANPKQERFAGQRRFAKPRSWKNPTSRANAVKGAARQSRFGVRRKPPEVKSRRLARAKPKVTDRNRCRNPRDPAESRRNRLRELRHRKLMRNYGL